MRAVTHFHTHTHTERQHGPVDGVRQRARGSGGGADGGDQARGCPGLGGMAQGVIGSVCSVRNAAVKESGRGRARHGGVR